MKITTFLSIAICTAVIALPSMGQMQERPGHSGRDGGIVEKIKLSDSQKKDFEKLNTDFAKQRVEQRSKIEIAGIELHSLLTAESPDKSAIEKKINEIGNLQAQNRMLRVDHWFSVNKLLNPDQQKVWKDMLNRHMRERVAQRLGRMRGGGMMPHSRPLPPDGDEQ